MAKGAQDDMRNFARQQLKKKQGFKNYLVVYAGVTGLVTAVGFCLLLVSYFGQSGLFLAWESERWRLV